MLTFDRFFRRCMDLGQFVRAEDAQVRHDNSEEGNHDHVEALNRGRQPRRVL